MTDATATPPQTAGLLIRPQPSHDGGLIGHEHFQVAYVTNDLDRACALFGDYGLTRFSFLEGEMAGGGSIRVAFAWAGRVMYEVIDCRSPDGAFYTDRLPPEFGVRFHHLGYLLPDRDAWDALRARIIGRGRPIAFETHNPGFMDAIYIDAPEFGHYLEYILTDPAGDAFFQAVPAN